MSASRDPETFRNVLAGDITKILGRGAGSFTITPLPQDASMRRYYRIFGTDFYSKTVQENTIALMVLADPNPKARSEEISGKNNDDNNSALVEEENLDFVNVQRHFESVAVPVPKLYLYNIENGLLYIEDLGDDLLDMVVARVDSAKRKNLYFEAIDNMVGIHEKATTHSNPRFIGFKRAFDAELLYKELMHFVDYAIEARKKIRIDANDMSVITQHMEAISVELAKEPRVVSHRDYQSHNILLKDGRLRIIDFQDALMGARQYDLVSLLRDSYVVLDWELIKDCIERYCAAIEKRTGAKIDRDRFLRVFHLQTLQRKIKDAGRFDYIDIVKKNAKFLQYIPDTLGYIREAFDALPEHRPMRDKLAKYAPELAG
jgi:aminoglycoside/choline kinase family phosphotransferase